jgi:hypothetical protein
MCPLENPSSVGALVIPSRGRADLEVYTPGDFGVGMILPGLIPLVFYKRRPSTTQLILGLLATVALAAVLGYVSPGGPLGVWGSVIVAIVGAVILYVATFAYLYHRYYPTHATMPPAAAPPVSPGTAPLAICTSLP